MLSCKVLILIDLIWIYNLLFRVLFFKIFSIVCLSIELPMVYNLKKTREIPPSFLSSISMYLCSPQGLIQLTVLPVMELEFWYNFFGKYNTPQFWSARNLCGEKKIASNNFPHLQDACQFSHGPEQTKSTKQVRCADALFCYFMMRGWFHALNMKLSNYFRSFFIFLIVQDFLYWINHLWRRNNNISEQPEVWFDGVPCEIKLRFLSAGIGWNFKWALSNPKFVGLLTTPVIPVM
jgi:hypothetical protein